MLQNFFSYFDPTVNKYLLCGHLPGGFDNNNDDYDDDT